MSYSICRIAKVKASGVTGIQIHDRREKDGTSHTNEDIDWSKTDQNIDLLQQQERFRTVVANRISELNLKRKPRNDATVMCQCLITSDSAFFDKMSKTEQVDFFKKSLDFVEKRYGKENLVSATIHFDERTPHMHVNFIPVTKDGRLSARDLFSPKDLRQLQDDFNRNCVENGYSLKRGELHSQKEHLSVEEYKIATRYDELKEKEQQVEKLEKIDRTVDLTPEKGKLGYSTKEVQSLKEQNKALRLDNVKQTEQIHKLENEYSKLSKMLVQVEKDLKDTNIPIQRLNDLENENRALQDYINASPTLKTEFVRFNLLKQQSYDLGKFLVSLKRECHNLKIERNNSIQQTSALDKSIKECDNSISDLKNHQSNINYAWDKYKGYEKELEGLNGFFKGKQRQVVQENMSSEQVTMQNSFDYLKKTYGIEPTMITPKIQELEHEKNSLQNSKLQQCEKTDELDNKITLTIKEYKYTKTLSDIQTKEFKEISSRLNTRTFTNVDDRDLYISKQDRTWILKRMKEKLPDVIDRVDGLWKMQDAEKREVQFNTPKLKSHQLSR